MESSSADTPAVSAEPAAPTEPDRLDRSADSNAVQAEPGEHEPTENEPTEAEATENEPVASAGEAERAGPAPRPNPLRRVLVAAALAAIVAGAGYEGWLLFEHHRVRVAEAQALGAAEKYALALTSVDPNAIDKNFAEVLDGATGEFKRMYAESSEQLRQLLIENKAAAHGTVIDAGVKSATKDRVEVMLFIDQSVSNAANPGPQLDRSRIVITMEKVDGRWLASKVDMR